MRHFPAFLDLAGRPALLLGEGDALAAKSALLHASGAQLREAARFEEALLDGCAIAVAAGAPEEDLHALHAACLRRGIPVNVVDRPELCSFITPAIVTRDDITIGISTGGAAPVLARLIRQKVEIVLPPLLGCVAELGRRFQAGVRARLPGLPARRVFLERALTGEPAQLALAGRQPEAEAAFARMLEQAEAAPRGFVQMVGTGPSEPDLLTLRALRALGEADVIVHGPRVGAGVLDLARRDARRIAVAEGASVGALLAGLAREGLRVVRLEVGNVAVGGGEEARELAAAGLAFELVPGLPLRPERGGG